MSSLVVDAGVMPQQVTAGAGLLAKAVLARRLAMGLTQADLQRHAGPSPVTVRNIEKAQATPDRRTLSKLDTALAWDTDTAAVLYGAIDPAVTVGETFERARARPVGPVKREPGLPVEFQWVTRFGGSPYGEPEFFERVIDRFTDLGDALAAGELVAAQEAMWEVTVPVLDVLEHARSDPDHIRRRIVLGPSRPVAQPPVDHHEEEQDAAATMQAGGSPATEEKYVTRRARRPDPGSLTPTTPPHPGEHAGSDRA